MIGSVGVAPGTTTLKLPDGSAIQISDWIDDRYYSTIQLTNGQSTPLEAFSAGRSQTIPGGTRTMTRVDTNVPRSGDGGLPKDHEMLIYSIGVFMTRVMRANSAGNVTLVDGVLGSLSNPPQLQTLFSFDRVTFLEMQYNGKTYSSGVMQDYPQGHGYWLFTTNSDTELAENGVPSPRDRNSLVLPIHLREQLSYKMVFNPEAAVVISQTASDGGTALTFADVKTEFVGLIKRPVV